MLSFDFWLSAAEYGFLALIYLFVLWAIKVISRETGAPRRAIDAKPYLTVRVGGDGREPTVLRVTGEALIGRAPRSDIRLEDAAASAEHARISYRRDHWFIEDLDSTNGTVLNGRRLTSATRLALRDKVEIGRTELVVEEDRHT